MKKGAIEEMAIIGGLITVQFVYAGNSVLMGYLMSLGLGPFTIVIFSTFATFLILSPFALFFERKQWPREFSLKLMVKLVLISFAGVTVFQSLFLEGIRLTSPAVATAMPNLAPALIFVIAWISRLEKVNLKCFYSKVKILGTLLCVVGAFAMSLIQSSDNGVSRLIEFDEERVVGCLYLLGAVIVLSSNVVLQASTLGDFPAPVSLCALTSLIGVLITAAVQFFQNQSPQLARPLITIQNLVAYSLLGGTVSGACVSFNGWAMKKRGPVVVSMFSPVSTVVSALLSFLTLGEMIPLPSIGGMLLMFTGLYLVLWSKGKEEFSLLHSPFDD
ncbi:PREDICTED: WAT1-related protein At5g47470 isoform X2 [Tarenaya hassleriana]|nr:PREDICTED: WAT1-related protein At5g47470 isoform X2 [Tarenaya hassleriana]